MPFLQVYLDEYNTLSSITYTMDQLVNEINCHLPFVWFRTVIFYLTLYPEAIELVQLFIGGFKEITNQYADGTGILQFLNIHSLIYRLVTCGRNLYPTENSAGQSAGFATFLGVLSVLMFIL